MGTNPRRGFSSFPAPQKAWGLRAPLVAVVLWMFLWANLDTGFWDIVTPNSLGEWVSAIRGCLPFFVLPMSAFVLIRKGSLPLPLMAPSRLLLIYGIVATISGIYSPEPMWAAYWSIAYLATILTAWTFVDGRSP